MPLCFGHLLYTHVDFLVPHRLGYSSACSCVPAVPSERSRAPLSIVQTEFFSCGQSCLPLVGTIYGIMCGRQNVTHFSPVPSVPIPGRWRATSFHTPGAGGGGGGYSGGAAWLPASYTFLTAQSGRPVARTSSSGNDWPTAAWSFV